MPRKKIDSQFDPDLLIQVAIRPKLRGLLGGPGQQVVTFEDRVKGQGFEAPIRVTVSQGATTLEILDGAGGPVLSQATLKADAAVLLGNRVVSVAYDGDAASPTGLEVEREKCKFGHLKLIVTLGCRKLQYIQLIRRRITRSKPGVKSSTGYDPLKPPGAAWGFRLDGGTPQNPTYPGTSKQQPVAAIDLAGPVSPLVDPQASNLVGCHFESKTEIRTWVLCDGRRILCWKWGFVLSFDVVQDGAAIRISNAGVRRVPTVPRAVQPGTASFAAEEQRLDQALR